MRLKVEDGLQEIRGQKFSKSQHDQCSPFPFMKSVEVTAILENGIFGVLDSFSIDQQSDSSHSSHLAGWGN
jgi:hypothetical protein